jgi:hypothetical protein
MFWSFFYNADSACEKKENSLIIFITKEFSIFFVERYVAKQILYIVLSLSRYLSICFKLFTNFYRVHITVFSLQLIAMKSTALIYLACLPSISAFAPSRTGALKVTELNAEKKGFFSFGNTTPSKQPEPKVEKKSLFSTIFDMDLFAPNKDVNDYGARSKKKIVTGKIGPNSYVPSGLTAEQYNSIRAEKDKQKAANYQKNVAKAGKFIGYDEFYLKRGTDLNGSWKKDVNLGHRMAKTKYDWSGDSDKPLWAKKAKK